MSHTDSFSTAQGSRPPEGTPAIHDLVAHLSEAAGTIRAIHFGEVDALVVNGPLGERVYTIEGADHPYRLLVEQMHEGTVTLGRDGLILYSNPQFAAMIGAPSKSVTGTAFSNYLLPADSNRFTELIETVANLGHGSGELSLRTASEDALPVRLSLTLFEVVGMQIVSILVSDLREQLRNEAIVKEEQLSRLILEQAGEAIVVIDPEGIILRRSESAKTLAGNVPISLHFDRSFSLTASGEPLTAARILSAARAGLPIRGLEALMHRGGSSSSALLVSASPLWNKSSELLGCVVTLTDITERKRAEVELARQAEDLARSNSDLRQFAYSASHDLREPLRQIAVFSELLQKKYEGKFGPEGAELIAHIVGSARRVEQLLTDLATYTQAADAPQANSACSDANEVVRRILATFERQIAESEARIECESLPVLDVHEVHLVQLFQNLIANALKYRSEAPPRIRISAERQEPMWRLSVEDNGIGIARPYQSQVFGLFQRLHGGGKYPGSGIGLAICQKIVQRYGGRLWVESELGRGSKFLFTLPGSNV